MDIRNAVNIVKPLAQYVLRLCKFTHIDSQFQLVRLFSSTQPCDCATPNAKTTIVIKYFFVYQL